MAFFRIGFGLVLVYETYRFFTGGWIPDYFAEADFRFKYYGFGWVQPLPGSWPWVECGLFGIVAFLFAIGLAYRWMAVLLCLLFTHFFLIEKTRYLNHFYLVLLLLFLMIFVPAHREWSLDARRWKRRIAAPAWSLGILRFQIGLVYLYAAVAKMNVDWLRAAPVTRWVQDPEKRSHMLVGPLLDLPGSAWVIAYGGLLVDLLAWPLLTWRVTRPWMYVILVCFHLLNNLLFSIGIFPWTMIIATTIFFEPDWPRRFLRGARSLLDPPRPARSRRRWIVAGLTLYIAYQVLVPLRHFLYPGRVSWNEEGHNFAWHMKLRSKSAEVTFLAVDPDTGDHRIIDPRVELTERQYDKMSGRPDLILQYAHHLAQRLAAEREGARVEIRATALCSLNGRKHQLLLDPAVDLARQRRGLQYYSWILPLEEPLPWPPPVLTP